MALKRIVRTAGKTELPYLRSLFVILSGPATFLSGRERMIDSTSSSATKSGSSEAKEWIWENESRDMF